MPRGPSAETWVDFDLSGHQIVAHLDPDKTVAEVCTPRWSRRAGPHGVVTEMGPGEALAERLTVYVAGLSLGLILAIGSIARRVARDRPQQFRPPQSPRTNIEPESTFVGGLRRRLLQKATLSPPTTEFIS
ncbi:MAG: Glyoxalase [Bradyrhizobium sp.]|nr:Glyoxalase [Bradyrhizobium sp.]